MEDKTTDAVARLNDARFRYRYDYRHKTTGRCFDCESVRLGPAPGENHYTKTQSGICYLLNIAIANVRTSRCPLYCCNDPEKRERDEAMFGGRHA